MNVVETAHVSEQGQLYVGNHTHFHSHTASADLLAALRTTDPRDDKDRIEAAGGGILHDAYSWVLANQEFLQWRAETTHPVLWVRGDAGKGKTMLLCGIIDELSKNQSLIVSYFFCQAAHKALRSATSVLRGLIYLLVMKEPSLRKHVKNTYKNADKEVFEDHNAWIALRNTLRVILKDPLAQNMVLVIDGLDECLEGLQDLTSFLAGCSEATGCKWLVSSRNWPDIQQDLQLNESLYQINLELNQQQVSDAIGVYINHQVCKLQAAKKYDNELAVEVKNHLTTNSNDTFLWVALVCKELSAPKVAKRHTHRILAGLPRGLPELYTRMMEQINDSFDAQLFKAILAIMSTVYRPVRVAELRRLSTGFAELAEDETEEVIQSCGSFLTLQKGSVYFVHQSAKDFLLDDFSGLLSTSLAAQHEQLYKMSIAALRHVLRVNIYSLESFGTKVHDINRPKNDPLLDVEYSCRYFLRHFYDRVALSKDIDLTLPQSVIGFFSNHFLTWIEALSVLRCLPENCIVLQKCSSIQVKLGNTSPIFYDVAKFVAFFLAGIPDAPLQVYVSGRLFCPLESWVQAVFRNTTPLPDNITLRGNIDKEWGKCVMTFEDSYSAQETAISPDGRLCACSSPWRRCVSIWEVDTGVLLSSISTETQEIGFTKVQFFDNNTCICGVFRDGAVVTYDVASGKKLKQFPIFGAARFLCISSMGKYIMSTTDVLEEIDHYGDNDICVENGPEEEDEPHTGEPEGDAALEAEESCCIVQSNSDNIAISITEASFVGGVFSADETLVALAATDKAIRIYGTSTGHCVATLQDHPAVLSLDFVMKGRPMSCLVFDAQNRSFVEEFCQGTKTSGLRAVSFGTGNIAKFNQFGWNQDCSKVLYAKSIWGPLIVRDVKSGEEVKILQFGVNDSYTVEISNDGGRLLSAKRRQPMRVWDISDPQSLATQSESRGLQEFAFSPSGRFAASMDSSDFSPAGFAAPPNTAGESCIMIWSTETATRQAVPSSNSFAMIEFSRDDKLYVRGYSRQVMQTWDAPSLTCLRNAKETAAPAEDPAGGTLLDEIVSLRLAEIRASVPSLPTKGQVNSSLSPDKSLLVTWSPTLKLCDAKTGKIIHDFDAEVSAAQFSSDGTQIIAHLAIDGCAIWDVASHRRLYRLEDDLPGHFEYRPSTMEIEQGGAKYQLEPAYSNRKVEDGAESLRCVGLRYDYDFQSSWVMRGDTPVLWVPPQYRPKEVRGYSSAITMALESSQMIFMEFGSF